MGRSIFATETQATIAVPFDPGQTVTVRALTGREADHAQRVHMKAITSGEGGRGWASAFQRRLAAGLATEADAVKVIQDPLAGFDRYAVIQAGLVGWSYPVVFSPETVADLGDEAAEFIAIAILRLTTPDRFRTPEEVEASRKND